MTAFHKHTHTQPPGQPVDTHPAAPRHNLLDPASPAPNHSATMRQRLVRVCGQLRERGGARRSRRPAAARQLSVALLLALVLSLLGLGLSGGRSAASRQTTTAASGQNGLAAALNPDGSLRAGARGSFDTSGFRMELTAPGAPRFVAAPACNG